MEPAFRFVAGLGNPGREYERTRHNIGFLVLDELAKRGGFSLHLEKKWRAEIAVEAGIFFCKPLTFMNLSGESIASVAAFYKILPSQMLIVLDDVALPLGRLRMRLSGSAGGHNGLQSIVEHLGTTEVPRLRVGIGAATDKGLSDHVLGRFEREEWPLVEQTVARAVEAIETAQKSGAETAMNIFNQTKANE